MADEMAKRAAICAFLEANVGDPYTFGAEIGKEADPKTGDCSEYMEQAYVRAGEPYPDGCINQQAVVGHRKVKEPKPGDPFFFGPNAKGTRHTGAYIGRGLCIHAAGGKGVIVEPRSTIERHPRFLGFFRHPSFAYPPEDRA